MGQTSDRISTTFRALYRRRVLLRCPLVFGNSQNVEEFCVSVTPDKDYDFVPPLPKQAEINRGPKGTQCGECGMKFEYGKAYGYCCTNLRCPCGLGPLS